MITVGIKAPSRAAAIQFMLDKGIIIKYSAPVYEDVPDQWLTKAAPAVLTKAPTATELAAMVEVVKVDAHRRLKEQEFAQFDAMVIDESGLRDPITRTLVKGSEDGKTAPVIDTNFYVILRLNTDDINNVPGFKGGTLSNTFTLSKRAELTDAVKQATSRTIDGCTIFKIGGEDGVDPSELNRTFM